MECPLLETEDGQYCVDQLFNVHEMVQHWREFHEMEDVTMELNHNDAVVTYRHDLRLPAIKRTSKQIYGKVSIALICAHLPLFGV
jgi:hypothetical protein